MLNNHPMSSRSTIKV